MTEVLFFNTFGKITSQCFLRLILGTIDYNNYDNLTYTIYFVRRFVIIYANVAIYDFCDDFCAAKLLYPLKSQTDCVQYNGTVDIELRVCAIEAVIESPTPHETAAAQASSQRHSRVGAAQAPATQQSWSVHSSAANAPFTPLQSCKYILQRNRYPECT